jgi:hypothetical protein
MDGPTDPACRPALAGTDDAAVLRRPQRALLAAAIEELGAAGAELAAAQGQATRLGALIAEAARLADELAALRAVDERRLGAWLAEGGGGPRPEPSPEIDAAEARLAASAGDAAAARAALPAAEQVFQRCAAKVRELQRRRDEALCAAAVDAACDFAEGCRAALAEALDQEAVLHGLRDELLARGNGADAAPGAMDAAARIGRLIAETRRAAAVRRGSQPAQRLLAALAADPGARLERRQAP